MTFGSLILGMLGGSLVVIVLGYVRHAVNRYRLRKLQRDIRRRLEGETRGRR